MVAAEINGESDRDDLAKVRKLIAIINSGSMSRAAYVAAELRIPDLLANGRKGVDELAQLSGSHPPSLRRLLHALVSLDLCTEHEDGSFGLGSLGAFLRTDAPNSLRSWTIWCCGHMWPIWEDLLHSVRTGESARRRIAGTDGFGHLERDAKTAAVFNLAMAEVTSLVASEVVRVYDFSGMRRIVDVGGGYGTLLAAILDAYPSVEGVLLDLPHAIEGARTRLADAGLATRCELIAGNFFGSIPAGADTYLLKAVVHDWDDERSAAILGNCRRVIPQKGKLLLIERILPPRFEASSLHHAIARADLNMLIAHAGRERTEAEFRALLHASGFQLARVIPTSLEYSILEAVPN